TVTPARTSMRGFTLLEVVVSVAIFAILSVLAYRSLAGTFENIDRLNDRMQRIQAVQRSMRIIGRDFMQAAPRPVRDPFNEAYVPSVFTSLSSDFALQITRGGWSNPAGLPRSTQQRVAYRIEEDALVRYNWLVLDPTLANEPVATVLLENVESVFFRYRTSAGDWLEQWPPENVAGPTAWRMRPQAVEVIFVLPDEGEISRFFEVAL
ncbi:MAG: type II secretion system minor pseudopilin GspJ, partial [Woeseiaceae bacterium]|nr:type II secretion system minor pseudopilin GspJ [Woeseiaceae bacterium]